MKLTRLRVVRRLGEGIEAVADDGMGPRVTAWPGETPPRPPKHRSLTRPLRQELLLPEGPYWLELRPPGALLSELGPLAEGDLAMLLLDLAEALAALHGAGQVHGAVDAEHVVVAPGGKAVLIGAGRASGTPADDARALRMLMAALWPTEAKAPPPDPGPEPAEVIAESLSGWLDFEYPSHSAFHLGSRSLGLCPPPDPEVEYLDEVGGLDEVGVDLGPDGEVRGLMDTWTTGHSTATRTREAEADDEDVAPSTALLGRLMSPSERAPDPARFAGQEEAAAQALRGLLAEEPLDALHAPGLELVVDEPVSIGLTEDAPVEDDEALPGFDEPEEGEARPWPLTPQVLIGGLALLLLLLLAWLAG
ncbi:MAG: hypothetical protein H6740_18315 [Alphaproteobacteria bacterium]|nr:hypothetical protein [Alphaproteobacteria bacterium]